MEKETGQLKILLLLGLFDVSKCKWTYTGFWTISTHFLSKNDSLNRYGYMEIIKQFYSLSETVESVNLLTFTLINLPLLTSQLYTSDVS